MSVPLQHRVMETTIGQLRHPLGRGDVSLVFGNLAEGRQLVHLLKSSEAVSEGASLGRDDHHRRMSPEGGSDSRDKVGDARAVLSNADPGRVGHPGVSVCHVDSVLFVLD